MLCHVMSCMFNMLCVGERAYLRDLPNSRGHNDAEYCFSCWKAHIRYYQFVHRVQLSAIIYETRACITPAKCFRWFQNTWKYYGPCFRKEMILN